ncbi:hypothetical protein [Microcystis phage Mae-JY29]
MPLSREMHFRYIRNRNRLEHRKAIVARRQKRGLMGFGLTLRRHKSEEVGGKKFEWNISRDSWPKSWRAPNHVRKPSLARERALDRQGIPF